MAKRSTPVPQPPVLSVQQIDAAMARFRRRLEDLDKFDPESVTERSDPRIAALEASIDEAVAEAFGQSTAQYGRYSAAGNLDTATINFMHATPMHEVIEGLQKGKGRAIALLNAAVTSLLEKRADVAPVDFSHQDRGEPQQASEDVFVVHGHDGAAKTEVARLIERAGLKAVILHEQPNAGQTIIEKFEAHGGAAGFAVVVITPDDVGGSDVDHLRQRATQNVIGEMFWFAGRLGRDRVCALVKGDIEMPSDVAGVGYTDMDDRGAWKAKLLRELDAAGYEINWAKAMA
jgi:predicted nucleotide-binding protein